VGHHGGVGGLGRRTGECRGSTSMLQWLQLFVVWGGSGSSQYTAVAGCWVVLDLVQVGPMGSTFVG